MLKNAFALFVYSFVTLVVKYLNCFELPLPKKMIHKYHFTHSFGYYAGIRNRITKKFAQNSMI